MCRSRTKGANDHQPRFSKVLPPLKVAKLHQIENKARVLLNYELARGIPFVK